MLIVQKYGGSSLKDPERLRHVARLCRERAASAELVVVVSAMGGETDALTGRAHEMNTAPSARELDALVTTGEQKSAALLVMTMEEMGLPAVSLTGWQAGILTDEKYGDGDIRLISPGRIRRELSRGRVPVVTGFQGVCAAGDVTSLGRGGSDTTAVALAAAGWGSLGYVAVTPVAYTLLVVAWDRFRTWLPPAGAVVLLALLAPVPVPALYALEASVGACVWVAAALLCFKGASPEEQDDSTHPAQRTPDSKFAFALDAIKNENKY